MEVQALFRRLTDPNCSHTRSHEGLRNLRKRLKRVGSAGLPHGDHCEYFEVLYELLGDNRWKVVCESTMLMVDMVPFLPNFELDHCLTMVMPRVIPNLGHFSTDVRRASLRLLHVYMRYTNNLQKVLRAYIQHGLVSGDKAAQKGAILSLPLLFTDEFANENLFILVQTLSELLVSSDTALFYPVFLALQRLQSLVGKSRFKVYMNHVRPDAVLLFHRVASRNSTVNSEYESDTNVTSQIEPSIYEDNSSQQPELISKDSIDSMTTILPSDLHSGLSYGIFPRFLIRKALSEKVPEKLDGLRQMLLILNESSQAHMLHFAHHLHDFVKTFVRDLMDSVNYKVTLYGLDILLVIVERLKMSVIGSLHAMTAMLLKHLGDTRLAVREHNIRIIHRLMFSLPPQMVLESLLEHKFHKNARVREEIANRITAAVLNFPRQDLNLSRLCDEAAAMLIDVRRIVRLAAMEAVAVLAHALGPRHVDTIYSAVKEIQDSSEAYGLLMAVQARLARGQMPRTSTDGLVRHVLNPISFASYLPHESDADMEWVLMGGSASNTPTKMVSHKHKNNKYTPSKGTSMQPQVSFDVSSVSDSSVQQDPLSMHRNSLKQQDSDTCDDCVISRPPLSRKKKSRAENFQPRIFTSGSSSNGESIRSDDSQARDLWRYYLTMFQESAPGVAGVSLPSNDQGRIANDLSRPFSADSSTSGDSGRHKNKNLIPPPDAKFQRATSMPAMISGNLSDISERSEQETNRKLASRKPSVVPPEGGIAADKRRVSIAVGALDRPSRLERQKTPNPVAKKQQIEASRTKEESSKDQEQQEMGQESRQSSRPASASSTNTEATQIVNTAEPTANENTNSLTHPCNDSDKQIYGEKAKNSTAEPASSTDPCVQVNISTYEDSKHAKYQEAIMKDAQTQKDESDSSGDQVTVIEAHDRRRRSLHQETGVRRESHLRYLSKSKSPCRKSRNPYHTRVEPAISPEVDVYGILANVAQTEGSFLSPEEALRAAISAFTQDVWTTKVEAMLVISRLATFHPNVLNKELHTVVLALVYEVRNLRSSVARSAIYTLGDLLVKMKRKIELDVDVIAGALLGKCGENVMFIREDIDRALTNLIEEMPQSKSVLALVTGGAHHRNSNVRRTTAQYLASLVEKMGPNKCLLGPRDVAEQLLPAAARFVQDSTSPLTRHYGRAIFATLYLHPQFEKLMRRFLTPPVYRNICGVLESIKRRGVGEKPAENIKSHNPI